MKFSTWYYPSEEAPIEPQRKALLDGEVSAAMGDKIVRTGMQEEGLLDYDENCDDSEFLVRRRNFVRCCCTRCN